jgi:BirA family biotin operon repressor/biotin-[acetyl-CoA-carboxylase] ligase
VGRRKLAGVLCESTGGALVAGIGVNLRRWTAAPADLAERVTSLEAEGGMSLPANVLAGLIVRDLKQLRPALDPAALAALAARDALLGAAVDTEEHGRGVARGIERDGALVLERPDGSRVRVVAGSVTRTQEA